MKKFDELYAIATRKSQYDQTNTWFKGVETSLAKKLMKSAKRFVRIAFVIWKTS